MTIPSHLIALWDASLSPGQSDRMVCPICGGGTSRESSFVVSKKPHGGLVWICHRAGCGTRGGTGAGSSGITGAPSGPRPHAVPPSVALGQPRSRYFLEKYGIDPYTLRINGVAYDLASSGDYFPIRHWSGKQLGFQLRWPDRVPKCRTYLTTESEYVTMDWRLRWTCSKVPYVIVVEDPISRIKLSGLGYDAVCLFGTHFSRNHALEIQDRTYEVLFWLDPDAYNLACQYARDYNLSFRCQTVLSDMDPKDTNAQIIRELLRTQCGIEPPGGNFDESEL